MIVKINKNEKGEIILAVCDKELIGKCVEEGGAQLDLTTEFYDGDELNDGETGDLIRNSYLVNLVGKKAVHLGLKEELIQKENVKTIAGVPYAQFFVE